MTRVKVNLNPPGSAQNIAIGSHVTPRFYWPAPKGIKDLVDKIDSSLQLHFEGIGDRWGLGVRIGF